MIGLAELLQNDSWAIKEFKNMGIKCGRLLKRFIVTMITLSKKPSLSISAASANVAEAKAIYRMIDNKLLTNDIIMETEKRSTICRLIESEEKTVLAIQDTTTLNYSGLVETNGLGDIGGSKNTQGLIAHSTIAVLPSGLPFGLLDQKIWARDPQEDTKKKKDRDRPIEEKESYKWIKAMEDSNSCIPKDIRIINVCDREGDFFEFFSAAMENRRNYLVRAVWNRNIEEEEGKLFEAVKKVDSAGVIIVDIPRDTRKNIKARKAALEIRHTKVKISVPPLLKNRYKDLEYLELYIVHAIEGKLPQEYVSEDEDAIITEKSEPIEWFLVTNVPVENFGDAVEKVKWYVQRWKIERFHYVLKSGCEIEELQFETADRIIKLVAMYSIIAVRLLCITYVARINPEISCETVLEENEWKILYCLANRTKIPPEIAPTAKEAVLYLAKLGGFLGRKGDGEPGVKVVWRGFRELDTVVQYANYIPDVSSNNVRKKGNGGMNIFF